MSSPRLKYQFNSRIVLLDNHGRTTSDFSVIAAFSTRQIRTLLPRLASTNNPTNANSIKKAYWKGL